MLPEFARFDDVKKGTNVEAGLIDMHQRFDIGGMKVDRTLSEWIDEYRMYHRVDGQVMKVNEDLMCATRYGVMMLRYAMSEEQACHQEDRWSQRNKFNRGTWMSG